MTRKQSTTHRRLDPRREQRRRRLEKKLRAAERGVARGKIRRALQIYRALVAERPDHLVANLLAGQLQGAESGDPEAVSAALDCGKPAVVVFLLLDIDTVRETFSS